MLFTFILSVVGVSGLGQNVLSIFAEPGSNVVDVALPVVVMMRSGRVNSNWPVVTFVHLQRFEMELKLLHSSCLLVLSFPEFPDRFCSCTAFRWSRTIGRPTAQSSPSHYR